MRASLVALLLAAPSLAMAGGGDFTAALTAHVHAIEQRDWPAFESTLTRGDTLTFVALNGTVTTRRDEFAAAMRAWLADPDWSWQLELLSKTEQPEVGVAVYRVRYQDKDSQGKPYTLNYVLSLVFARQGSQWRLVHDQNTRIAPR